MRWSSMPRIGRLRWLPTALDDSMRPALVDGTVPPECAGRSQESNQPHHKTDRLKPTTMPVFVRQLCCRALVGR